MSEILKKDKNRLVVVELCADEGMEWSLMHTGFSDVNEMFSN